MSNALSVPLGGPVFAAPPPTLGAPPHAPFKAAPQSTAQSATGGAPHVPQPTPGFATQPGSQGPQGNTQGYPPASQQVGRGGPQRFNRGQSHQQGLDFEDSENIAGGPGGQCPPGYVRGIDLSLFHFLMAPSTDPSLCACSLGVVLHKSVFLIFISSFTSIG